MKDNKLIFLDLGSLEVDEVYFIQMLREQFNIKENKLQTIDKGFKFLFNNKYKIKVKFIKEKDSLIKIIIYGERAEDVIKLYNSYREIIYKED